MSLTGKLEHVQEIKSPGNVVLDIFGSKKADLPKICPDKVSRAEVLEGKWGEVDCILRVHFLFDGKELISEEKVEAVDEKNQSITYQIFGGDIMNLYKTLKITFQVTSEGDNNFFKSSFEYEKLNSDIPAPDQFKEVAADIIKKIDEHYLNAGA